MFIAARFPIKSNIPLYSFLVLSHVAVVMISFWIFSQWWLTAITLSLTTISFMMTHREYLTVTQSDDDLCWSGESWLMHGASNKDDILYLELSSTSWVTSHFCLLKFDQDEQPKAWFFTKKGLGERLYRQLCYLAKLDMKIAER